MSILPTVFLAVPAGLLLVDTLPFPVPVAGTRDPNVPERNLIACTHDLGLADAPEACGEKGDVLEGVWPPFVIVPESVSLRHGTG